MLHDNPPFSLAYRDMDTASGAAGGQARREARVKTQPVLSIRTLGWGEQNSDPPRRERRGCCRQVSQGADDDDEHNVLCLQEVVLPPKVRAEAVRRLVSEGAGDDSGPCVHREGVSEIREPFRMPVMEPSRPWAKPDFNYDQNATP